MKKSDLKTGMIIETRNGREYVVFIDTCKPKYIVTEDYYDEQGRISLIINYNSHKWTSLSYYDEDLCRNNGDKSSDITKVYIPVHPYSFMDITYEDGRNLIWERPEPIKEMTMKELEEHFGCKVKIVES